MIDSREQLIHVLTEAAEVEHNLLCSYLYAAFSLKRSGEAGLTEQQGMAVESWRQSVIHVALEEMAHLANVNNLLLAVGGSAHFDRPNMPVAPGYHPAGVVVRLTPFDQATLDHFIFLERPKTNEISDGSGFEPLSSAREERVGSLTPSAIHYDTIGDLYSAVAEAFSSLAARLGEGDLIDRSGRGQLGADEARLPEVRRITCLQEALEAIELIKEQGEGSSGARGDSHFDRFNAIKREWGELTAADATFAPAWPAAHDPVMRRPLDDVERVWVTSPVAAACLDVGNAAYGTMLTVLATIFGLEDLDDQRALMNAAVELMELAAATGQALARMPAAPTAGGGNAGLSFAVPRNLGYRPSYERSHLAERIAEVRGRAASVLQGEAAEKAERRSQKALDTLRGHR